MVDFVGVEGFEGSVLSSSILDTEPIGWRTYLKSALMVVFGNGTLRIGSLVSLLLLQ